MTPAMRWEKLGRIFRSSGQRPWIVSHSSVPMPEHVGGDVFRIYFTPRDAGGRSNVSWLTIDISRPNEVLDICDVPSLSPGPLGSFDDRGAMGSWIVPGPAGRYLYYTGWNTASDVPWRVSIGLAVASNAEPTTFIRHEGPVLDRSLADPYFVTNPCVLHEGGRWRMWYISGLPWSTNTPPKARYRICYAESGEGLHWTPKRADCIPLLAAGEVAISRPCVVRDHDCYRMWYSYRGDDVGYRIGYAESADGETWERMDAQAGLAPSASGWDADVAYPTVFDHGGRRFMLYCGNGYSAEGFGLAVLR